MNEKNRKRLPKPYWKKIVKRRRITESDKVAIAKEYDKRLKKENRDDILEDLALEWKRSTRRIEGYISKGWQIITHKKQEAESKRIRRDVLKEQVKEHFGGLAKVAMTLCDVQRFILSYEEDETFRVVENMGVPGFFTFQPPPRKHVIPPSFASSSVAVDCPAVEYFFEHLSQDFAELNLKEWRGLVESKLPNHVTERLGYLGNTAKFEYCTTCQVCKDLMA